LHNVLAAIVLKAVVMAMIAEYARTQKIDYSCKKEKNSSVSTNHPKAVDQRHCRKLLNFQFV